MVANGGGAILFKRRSRKRFRGKQTREGSMSIYLLETASPYNNKVFSRLPEVREFLTREYEKFMRCGNKPTIASSYFESFCGKYKLIKYKANITKYTPQEIDIKSLF